MSIDDAGRLADRWREQADRCDRVTQSALGEIAVEFVQAAGKLAGGAGPYQRSFTARPSGSAVEAGSTSPMAAVLERGRKPGRRPPPQSIRKRSGGSYEAAARAADRIAARGTRGRFVVKRAATQIRRDGTVEKIGRRALRTILDGGV